MKPETYHQITHKLQSVYEPHGIELEFVSGSGRTEALVTVSEADVRPDGDHERISVRPFNKQTA